MSATDQKAGSRSGSGSLPKCHGSTLQTTAFYQCICTFRGILVISEHDILMRCKEGRGRMQIKNILGFSDEPKWRRSNNDIDLLKIYVGTTLCRWVEYLLDPCVGNVGGEGRHSASSQVIFSFEKLVRNGCVQGYLFYNSYETLLNAIPWRVTYIKLPIWP